MQHSATRHLDALKIKAPSEGPSRKDFRRQTDTQPRNEITVCMDDEGSAMEYSIGIGFHAGGNIRIYRPIRLIIDKKYIIYL